MDNNKKKEQMSKNIIKTAFALAFAVLLSFNSQTSAAASVNLLQGQSHYYTVMMRSDKQSIVYARLVFDNESDKNNLKDFSFSVPDGLEIDNIAVQQIMAKSETQTCKKYEPYDDWKVRNGYTNSYTGSQYQYETGRKCLDMDSTATYNEEFDFNNNTLSTSNFYDYHYYNHRDDKLEYFDVAPKQTGNSYRVELPNEIKPKKQGALLVSYSTKDYISGGFLGRYGYNFKTLQVPQMVNKSVVSVNFDDELYSRLTTSKRTTSAVSGSKDMISAGNMSNSGYESRSIDDIQASIGLGGRYDKEKSQLMPGQVFEVAGVFTTNKSMLYIYHIVGWLFGLVALAILGFYGFRRYRRKHPIVEKEKKTDAETVNLDRKVEQYTKNEPELAEKISTMRIVAVSLASVGMSVIAVIIIGFMWSLVGDYSLVRSVVVPVLTILVIAFATFILPLLYVLRYGIRVAFIWTVAHVGIIIASMVLIGLILAAISGGNSTITPIDY